MKDVLLITIDSLQADYVFGPRAPDGIEALSTLAAERSVTRAPAPQTRRDRTDRPDRPGRRTRDFDP